MSRYNFYLINILFCIQLQAQDSLNFFINQSYIEKLHKGTLLVRLESKEKKIGFLNSAIMAKDCNQNCKEKIHHQIDEIVLERDRFNLQFIKSFKFHFSFCPVYFYYDKDHPDLVKDSFKGNFYLDENLKQIRIDTLQKDSLFIFKKDITPYSENEGWLIQTADGYTLKNGFPFISENNFRTIWNRIISSNHLNKNCDYMVMKLNKNLFEYLYSKQLDYFNLQMYPYFNPSNRMPMPMVPPPPPKYIPVQR